MSRIHFKQLVGAAAVAALAMGLTPSAASAVDSTGFSDSEILGLIEEYGVVPFGSEVAVQATDGKRSSASTILEEVIYESRVSVAADSAAGIQVSGDGGKVSIALPGDAKVARESVSDGVWAFDHGDGATTVPVAQRNGVKILSLIESADAPEKFSYKISTGGGWLEVHGEAVVVYQADGSVAGIVDVPWAYDASGRELDTEYTVAGDVLTQTVHHQSVPEVKYPVVADPNYSSGVLSKSTVSGYSSSNPGYKVSAYISAAGRYAYVVTPGLFSYEGWQKLRQNHPGYVLNNGVDRPTMKQQWDCHVTGGFLEWASWDLETGRSSNPNWLGRIGTVWPVSGVCNW